MRDYQKNTRKHGEILHLSLSLLIAATGLCCGRQEPDTKTTADSSDKAVAAQKILDADQLYAQREDLSKVRLGIALLRQARIDDYGNYEAAWKLAKFAYYLGAHTSDDRERATAFREGSEAGKTALQLHVNMSDRRLSLGANNRGSAE